MGGNRPQAKPGEGGQPVDAAIDTARQQGEARLRELEAQKKEAREAGNEEAAKAAETAEEELRQELAGAATPEDSQEGGDPDKKEEGLNLGNFFEKLVEGIKAIFAKLAAMLGISSGGTTESGSTGLASLEAISQHPRFRRRTAKNGLAFKTPEDYLNEFQNVPATKIGQLDLDKYPDGQVLGNLHCAFFISDILGLTDCRTGSAPALFAGLLKGGGRIIPEPRELEVGDVLFQRGTFGDKDEEKKWHGITHVGLIVGKEVRDGDLFIRVRHHGGSNSGVVTKEVNLSDPATYEKFDQHFYAGVRQDEIVAQKDKFDSLRFA